VDTLWSYEMVCLLVAVYDMAYLFPYQPII